MEIFNIYMLYVAECSTEYPFGSSAEITWDLLLLLVEILFIILFIVEKY